jgi:hypothetical protein
MGDYARQIDVFAQPHKFNSLLRSFSPAVLILGLAATCAAPAADGPHLEQRDGRHADAQKYTSG